MAIKKRYSTDDPKLQPDSHYKMLLLFSYLCNRSGKKYCSPSMTLISDLLEKRYWRRLGQRQINNIISFLVASGQIKKINNCASGRPRKNPSAQRRSNSYIILDKGLYLLERHINQCLPMSERRKEF